MSKILPIFYLHSTFSSSLDIDVDFIAKVDNYTNHLLKWKNQFFWVHGKLSKSRRKLFIIENLYEEKLIKVYY